VAWASPAASPKRFRPPSRAYHQPGASTNIYDPVANTCASMNYVIHRYGASPTGENFATMVQQADAHRPPRGY